jgi:hypothetical protein
MFLRTFLVIDDIALEGADCDPVQTKNQTERVAKILSR